MGFFWNSYLAAFFLHRCFDPLTAFLELAYLAWWNLQGDSNSTWEVPQLNGRVTHCNVNNEQPFFNWVQLGPILWPRSKKSSVQSSNPSILGLLVCIPTTSPHFSPFAIQDWPWWPWRIVPRCFVTEAPTGFLIFKWHWTWWESFHEIQNHIPWVKTSFFQIVALICFNGESLKSPPVTKETKCDMDQVKVRSIGNGIPSSCRVRDVSRIFRQCSWAALHILEEEIKTIPKVLRSCRNDYLIRWIQISWEEFPNLSKSSCTMRSFIPR
jgi:hypothetical protein